MIRSVRSSRVPLSLLLLAVYTAGLLPRTAFAAEAEAEREEPQRLDFDQEESRDVPSTKDIAARFASAFAAAEPAAPARTSPVAAFAAVAATNATDLTPKAVTLPTGNGTVEGLGAAFSAQTSTGLATVSVPFTLNPARGNAAPSLRLTYSSARGPSKAGNGWDVEVPYIARSNERGMPTYEDGAGGAWTPNQDRFVFGGEPLVPICQVKASSCSGALDGEVMPTWANGWQYFRLQRESLFRRVFWSPDHRTWRVQDKNGLTEEYGVPLDGTGDESALERATVGDLSRIFRWNIARLVDSQGTLDAPVNPVVFRYKQDGGLSYLVDVFDTPPVGGDAKNLAAYANHVRLVWEARQDVVESYRRGWRTAQALRLARVDISSKTFQGGSTAARRLARRYRLTYDPARILSTLTSVQHEGRCGTSEEAGVPAEDGSQSIAGAACAAAPATRFTYSTVETPSPTNVQPGLDPVDRTLRKVQGSPGIIGGSQNTAFLDINADGLVDLLHTNAAAYDGAHGVYLNGAGAPGAFGAVTPMTVEPLAGSSVNASTLRLAEPMLGVLDMDGDGVVELAFMAYGGQPYAFSPVVSPTGSLLWRGRAPRLAEEMKPKFDLAGRRGFFRFVDVNADGYLDVLANGGQKTEAYLGLGGFPGGDGQFGGGRWTGATTATLSSAPSFGCTPQTTGGVLFTDPSVRLADMNADGLVDFVYLSPTAIGYWPGRGDGTFGTGDVADCKDGAGARPVALMMANSPRPGPGALAQELADVNGDGYPDYVIMSVTSGTVWLNLFGTRWSAPIPISGAPNMGGPDGAFRLVDINGSGSVDLVWPKHSNYQYIDLTAGGRPSLLTGVDNGLGATTTIEYASSQSLMVEAAAAGRPWSSVMPMGAYVVRRVTETNNLGVAGRPPEVETIEYTYRDPHFDRLRHEFRGFEETLTRVSGTPETPSHTKRSVFLLGECVDESADDVDDCGPTGRWKENGREALKGLPVVEEAFDDSGKYLSTIHRTYRLRELYRGLDGRSVRQAFAEATDTYLYDVAAFAPSESVVSLDDFVVERAGTSTRTTRSVPLRSAAGRAHLRQSTSVDVFGNTVRAEQKGCVEGCSSRDETITQVAVPVLIDNGSGWLWRESASHIEGNLHGKWNQNLTTYDRRGNPIAVRGVLSGSLPLDRRHSGGGAYAPAPASASVDGIIPLVAQDYDAYGNPTFVRAPENQCTRIGYDPTYAQLAVRESVFVGGVGADQGGDGSLASQTFAGTRAGSGCGSVALTASGTYDRGIARVVEHVGLHGEKSRVEYDSLGRTLRVWNPHPYAVGSVSPLPSLAFEYFTPTDSKQRPYTLLHRRTHDGVTLDEASYQDTWVYIDGRGRALVSLVTADPSAGDGGDWRVSGLTRSGAHGEPVEVFEPWFWSGAPEAFPLAAPPASASRRRLFDAFGRILTVFGRDGSVDAAFKHHALSVDAYPRGSVSDPSRAGVYETTIHDGHGRIINSIARLRVNGAVRTQETRLELLPSGQPLVVTRAGTGAPTPIVRWMRYDSLGRRVANVEPNTSVGFVAVPAVDLSGIKTWRYAFDDAGRVVGTSDARGCGVNTFFDAGGRPIAEDYSPCQSDQAVYSTPNLVTGDGTEVFYRYDVPDPEVAPACPADPALTLGRITSVSDRGQKSVLRPDGRGRAACVSRKLARPLEPGEAKPELGTRYADAWFTQQVTYDAADRPVRATTGATEILSPGGDSFVRTVYAKSGAIRAVCSPYTQLREANAEDAAVCGGSGLVALMKGVERDARGNVTRAVYGDLASTATSLSYDARDRLSGIRTERNRPSPWSVRSSTYVPASDAGQPTTQLVLQHTSLVYDTDDRPTEIRDGREAADWPAGAKPQTRSYAYDDLGRVTKVTYATAASPDVWVSPNAAEEAEGGEALAASLPAVRFPSRVREQTFAFDAFGNVVQSDDDQYGFFDRSLGVQTQGAAADGPYQLRSATNRNAAGRLRAGAARASYDAAGQLVVLDVERDGPCGPGRAGCSHHFEYSWDEVGGLVRAQRWDGARGPVSHDGPPAADLRYGYAGDGSRVFKVTGSGAQARGTAYPLASLELRDAAIADGSFEHSARTEAPFLFVGGRRLGRLLAGREDLPRLVSGAVHLFLDIPDSLGSTVAVVDYGTGELVESASYLAYGATESDYRPERWGAFREDYRFTGKEDDAEVGLVYFGHRYLAPALMRWISPDPLALHGLDADLNLYAYVHGRVSTSIDPTGLTDGSGGLPNITVFSGQVNPNPRIVFDTGPPPVGPNGQPLAAWIYVPGGNAIDTSVVGSIEQLKFMAGEIAGAEVHVAALSGDDPLPPASVDSVTGGRDIFGKTPQEWFQKHQERVLEASQRCREIVDSAQATLGDTMQKVAHPLTEGSPDGVRGGLMIGACTGPHCLKGEWLQTSEALYSLYGTAQLAKAGWLIGTGALAMVSRGGSRALGQRLGEGLANAVNWKGFAKGSLAAHFEKHGAEFGNITQSQYLSQAKSFASEAGEFLEEKVGNFIVKYDPVTRRTIVGHAGSREIRTFYVADGRAVDPFTAAVDLARKLSGL